MHLSEVTRLPLSASPSTVRTSVVCVSPPQSTFSERLHTSRHGGTGVHIRALLQATHGQWSGALKRGDAAALQALAQGLHALGGEP